MGVGTGAMAQKETSISESPMSPVVGLAAATVSCRLATVSGIVEGQRRTVIEKGAGGQYAAVPVLPGAAVV